MRTFKEILKDITNACDNVLYEGYKNNYKEVIECATRIYIAEIQNQDNKE